MLRSTTSLQPRLDAGDGTAQHTAVPLPTMPLTTIDALGFIAGALTTSAFVPQVLKSWQTRDLSGVSLRMYSLFTLGVALWLAYGIALMSWPVIVCNAITLALAGGVLVLKIRHR
jgi:MtN3 and saliva related transmembrane protein